jgi:hypothetical protein
MSIINDIFRTYAPQYLDRFGADIPAQHRKVIADICACRTEANGTLIFRCPDCRHSHILNRGCGNRHCPGCQQHKGQQWLARQLEQQLPGHHFMVTFTVPAEIREFFRANQRLAYAALFAASAEALRTLAAEPRFGAGDLPGFFGVLHTWGRQLQYHPHIHYVVPGGFLDSATGQWHPTSQGFYLPVRALAKLVRARFRQRMAKAGVLELIPAQVWDKGWNVNCQAVGSPEASITYLTPYVFRVAIANSRIVKLENGRVFFRWRHQKSNRLRVIDLDALEFIRRFLQHVLPAGFMKVRHYGCLSPNFRMSRSELRCRVEIAFGFTIVAPTAEPPSIPPIRCEQCGSTMVWHCSILPGRDIVVWASG